MGGATWIRTKYLRVGLRWRGARKMKGLHARVLRARGLIKGQLQRLVSTISTMTDGACGLVAMERAKLKKWDYRQCREIVNQFFENCQSWLIRVEDGGVEPQPERSIRSANGARTTARSSSRSTSSLLLRKVQESNPDACAPPDFRDRCLHHADLAFQEAVLAAGIEPAPAH